ncbi:MAG TPA: sialidase family protein [Pirellulaceae bacterium]|nr:sialidase family protein [Pirellulaceae bacterium]
MKYLEVDSCLVVCLLASSLVWCAGTVVVSGDEERTEMGSPVLVEAKRIWDKAPHNAFTDLLRFQDRWYCVFREGTAHVSPDGALRVITSADGRQWKSTALVTSSTYDLRDAKLAVTPDGRLMLNGAGMIADAKVRYQSMCWFSTDAGYTWDDWRKIGDPGFWLWRTQWYEDVAYTMGYNTQRDRTKRTLKLYKSTDGETFETHVSRVPAPNGCGEDKILFLADKSALCLLRHETGDKMAQLGTAGPPYTDWKWRDLNLRIGGPNMIQLPDGRILAVTRLYNGGTRTSLSWLDTENATLTEALKLPSGGDTSYAGLVWHDGLLWISYYSSHEGKTSIYLARVSVPSTSKK